MSSHAWMRIILVMAVALGSVLVGTAKHANAAGQALLVSSPTNRGDAARDGWYPDQPLLNPANVGSSNFGQIFSSPVVGQVYAQPIVASNTLVVATEQDWIYGLDPVSGSQRWARQVGQPYPDANWACSDLSPYVGITSTPTVDPSTGTMYLVSMEQQNDGTLGYWMHAIDPSTGNEKPNFPVQIMGSASNDPAASFDANLELQRPGLLFLNNHIYAAFASHCDTGLYQGYVAGVPASGGTSSLWTDVNGTDTGGGIWQSGGGLVSDGSGSILLASGNGENPPTGVISGKTPPTSLGESVIRLDASDPNNLKAVDFFTPFDANALDAADLDFGSGSPVALPDSMGTSADPHLLMQVGKEGYVYLLNRDNLGGVGNGTSGGDGAVAKVGPYGGVWASPAVWPGDGGWIYLPTATGGSSSLGNAGQGNFNAYRVNSTGATPSISLSATAADPFGFGSSSAIVTSNQTTSGSAVVWVVRTVGGSGIGATLQAYDAVPNGSKLTLLGEWPVGQAAKFNQPGVFGNKLYVGSQDGHVRGFGILSAPALSAATPTFSNTVIGSAQTKTVVVNVAKSLHVVSVHTSTPQFAVSAVTPPIPGSGGLAVGAGSSFSVDVSFAPTGSVGGKLDTLAIMTDQGELDLTLSGAAVAAGPMLWESTAGISMGGVTTGSTASSSVTLVNFGTSALTFNSATAPTGPFSLVGVPAVGSSLAAGASVTVGVVFSPTQIGPFSTRFGFGSNGGNVSAMVSGVAHSPAKLVISPDPSQPIDFGSVGIGGSATRSVTLSNTGGSTMTITRSAAPTGGEFTAISSIADGTQLAPGESLSLGVTFQPDKAGALGGAWTLQTTAPGASSLSLRLSGTGAGTGYSLPSPGTGSYWSLNGSAQAGSGFVSLTQTSNFQAGSSFWPVPASSAALNVSYSSLAANGTGADASALVLADAGKDTPASLGDAGGGIGFAGGMHGYAIVLGEYAEAGAPGDQFVGVTDGYLPGGGGLHWIAMAPTDQPVQDTPTSMNVSLSGGTLSVYVNGVLKLSPSITAPPLVLVGFSGATGGANNDHIISDVRATVAGAQPVPDLGTPASLAFGNVAVGAVKTMSANLVNNTNASITVTDTSVSGSGLYGFGGAGQTILPGASAAVVVMAQPKTAGVVSGALRIGFPGGASSSIPISVRAVGAASGQVGLSKWKLNGSARLAAGVLTLTKAVNFQAGTAWSTTTSRGPLASVTFVPGVSPGTGGDGEAVLFAAAGQPVTEKGSFGWGMGFAPSAVKTWGVVLSEYPEAGAPGANFVGITNGGSGGSLHWLATAALPVPLKDLHGKVTVAVTKTSITVYIDGKMVLTKTDLIMPSSLRSGFSGGTGGVNDVHTVSNVLAVSS